MPALMKQLSKFSVLVLVAGLSVGCATTADLEKVRAEAAAASNTANQAMSTANEARQMAANANSCCQANSDKIDRMFQRSMMK